MRQPDLSAPSSDKETRQSLNQDLLSKQTPFKKLTEFWLILPENVRGALWMLAGGIFFTMMASLVKLVGTRLDSFQMAFIRCFFGFLVIIPLIWKAGFVQTFRSKAPFTHLTRSLIGTLAMGLFFYTLPRVPLADLTAISFSKPLFMIFLAVFILKEPVRWRRWTATLFGFVGVIIMVQPGSTDFDPTLLLALVATLCVAFGVILIKRLSVTETTLTMLAYFGVLSSLLMLIPAIQVWRWPTLVEWGMLLAIGIFGVSGQNCIIRAYRAGEATAVAPFDYMRFLFASVAGFFLFGEVLDQWTLFGAVLVIVSTLYIAHREAYHGQTHRDPNEGLLRKI